MIWRFDTCVWHLRPNRHLNMPYRISGCGHHMKLNWIHQQRRCIGSIHLLVWPQQLVTFSIFISHLHSFRLLSQKFNLSFCYRPGQSGEQEKQHLLRVSTKVLRIFMWRCKRRTNERNTERVFDLCALNEKNRHNGRVWEKAKEWISVVIFIRMHNLYRLEGSLLRNTNTISNFLNGIFTFTVTRQ